MGYATVDESARAVIKERLALGLSPRQEPLIFAHEIFRRDVDKYRRHAGVPDWTFFDRGAVEALAMVHDASPLSPEDLRSILQEYQFHQSVFVLPPWRAIYDTDAERDQSFEEAVLVHGRVVTWYRECGYTPQEVPRLPVRERASFVPQCP
jgi:predicted ATPase